MIGWSLLLLYVYAYLSSWKTTDLSTQLLMTARYALEVTAILKCGVGLHIEEVIAFGGPSILITFTQVSLHISNFLNF